MPFGASRAGLMSVVGDDIPDSGLKHEYFAQDETHNDQSTGEQFTDQIGDITLSAEGEPLFDFNGLSGSKSFVYNGTDDGHNATSSWLSGDGDEYTVAAVCRYDAVDRDNDQWLVGSDGGDRGMDFRERDGNLQYSHGGESATDIFTVNEGEPFITIGSYNGSEAFADVNGITELDGFSVDYQEEDNGSSIGYNRLLSSNYLDGAVGHVLWYDEFYDSDARSDIFDALNSIWGIVD